MPKYELKLDFLFEVVVYAPPIPIGPSSWGIRVIFQIEEGTIKGPTLDGKIRPFGADWVLLRPDKALELDGRYIIETDDGALIHTSFKGVADLTEEQYNAFLAGEEVKDILFFVTPRYETSHEKYQWLTRIQAVGLGSGKLEGDRYKVTYSVYILTA